MKNLYILLVLSLMVSYSCQSVEDLESSPSSVYLPSADINASGIMENVKADDVAKPMTRALIGSETVASIEGNFIHISEPNQSWTEESQYRLPASMPSFSEAKIVDGEIISSPDNSEARLRSIVFRPKLTYEYYTKDEGVLEPDVAYVSRMVGWYPATYDIPAGVDGKNSIAWFKDSGCMVEMGDGKIGVRFDKKLDGQTDLMMTDMREGRMYKTGFKHDGSANDHDIQPYGHSYVDPLIINDYRYINYFTFHHYLTAVKVYIKADAGNKGVIGMVNNVKFLNQPSSVTIALPTEQRRGGGIGPKVAGTTATLPIEGVQPIFGELDNESWDDFGNIDIVRTPMFSDPADITESELPVLVPATGELPETYLGYALLRPWGGDGDTYETKLQLYTDAGIYPITLPNVLSEDVGDLKEGDALLQPGQIYKLVISLKATEGLEVIISNDDDEKYMDLSPYSDDYGDYKYSNCYVVSRSMLDGDTYDGFYFRADVPGRGKKGDIAYDPYEADHKLNPKSVKILWQQGKNGLPIRHAELVQGVVRFKLSEPFVPGNAVIAAYDKNDDIIWSWHVWVSADDLSSISDILDRNLGAYDESFTDNTNVLDTYGLYYQWGRKDPTMGPMAWDYNIYDMRTASYHTIEGTRNDVAEVYMPGAAPTIEDGVRNPTVILAPSNLADDYLYDWLWRSNDDLWGGVSEKKTIYDPCPYGYRVPNDEIRTYLGSETSSDGNGYYSRDKLFFPSAGWKGDDVKSATRTHAWMAVGKAGDYQDASVDSDSSNRGRLFFVTTGFYIPSTEKTYDAGTANYSYTSRTIAAPVRCVRYIDEPLQE